VLAARTVRLVAGLAAAVPPVVAAAIVNAESSVAARAAMRRVIMVSPLTGPVPVGSGLLTSECVATAMPGQRPTCPFALQCRRGENAYPAVLAFAASAEFRTLVE
jgi:hypothetical protein